MKVLFGLGMGTAWSMLLHSDLKLLGEIVCRLEVRGCLKTDDSTQLNSLLLFLSWRAHRGSCLSLVMDQIWPKKLRLNPGKIEVLLVNRSTILDLVG